jgi:uracil-DNA glycosylase
MRAAVLQDAFHNGRPPTGTYPAPGALTRPLTACADRYLSRILNLSPAKVIIVLGSIAHDAVADVLLTGGPLSIGTPMTASIGGTKRHLIALPHPNARGVRRIDKVTSAEQVQALRASLSDR